MNTPVDAYALIKERILSLEYAPGTRLSEARLAASLGLGRSPIRTALHRLALEDWIIVQPQSGSVVAHPDPTFIRELTELRAILEGFAAEKATLALDDEAIRKLRHAYDAAAGADGTPDVDLVEAFDDLFHETVYAFGGNKRIRLLLLNLRDQVRWLRRYNLIYRVRLRASLEEMGVVVDAFERRDAPEAGRLAALHITNIGDAYGLGPTPGTETEDTEA
ncbi:GntR family transcriptional regulator [Oceaniovalibus sp. ACAM 378]|uniref:GntR family transcriptional regulator n=1 Tax=Oceaniovalibus sp. ACAM 378 TaxID=2599923 RepID=UPI0011D47939|nr:GntR family transcriptional regulator [Oceaniovalibus sp. ACAM 378]TYB83600.1 GntR family transcriptional regulator [Oceaniovalibus sp. ACAM 378]